MSKKWLLSLTLAVSVPVIAACNSEDETAGNNSEEPNTQEEESAGDSEQGEGNATQEGEEDAEQAKMPEPDLEGTPDVVAEVNGEEITKEEFESTYESQFQQAAMQSQMTGEEVDQTQLKEQIAESLVGTKLLTQEADNRGFDASQEDIDETLDELVEQNGVESEEEFMAAIEEQGMSEEEVLSQVETQVEVDQLIADETGDIEPTEEELEEAYDQMTAQQEQMGGEEAEVPSFDEVKPDLKEQVKMQKEGEVTQSLIEELREGADITVNL
ncbi:SurA N-terminal domain-containing protein [Alteribacillus bidgolensis]|uniref:peptidylprolyl isomerase n=1 Tax=Alteribacillus bidgolensis TaxID=930129 RepID=A0A1G8MNH4_9BACI|nr:SurA N-terminal domain-containing protein [Alteribacillus bidgolensis]SDI68870.1 peptidyl-prolyl cis-trans isomerase SurA [Alteribacillus bidgolensis]